MKGDVNSSMEDFDQSMSVVKASELFPRRRPCEFDAPDLEVPFKELYGEFVEYVGLSEEGVVALSNLRIYLKTASSFVNLPLGLVDGVEIREIFYLVVLCKDARTLRLTFATNEQCQTWHRRLFNLTALPKRKEDIFAYWFHAYCSEDSDDRLHSILSTPDHAYVPDPGMGLEEEEDEGGGGAGKTTIPRDDLTLQLKDQCPSIHFSSYKELLEWEVKRMGFDLKVAWKISSMNADYSTCSTYPPYLLIPGSVSDDMLKKVGGYRSYGRVPNVVWRHSGNGAVIARCSQPQVGILGWRCYEDEDVIKALGDACSFDPGPHPTPMPRSRHGSSLAACPEEGESARECEEDRPDGSVDGDLEREGRRGEKAERDQEQDSDDDDNEVGEEMKPSRRRATFSTSSDSSLCASGHMANSVSIPTLPNGDNCDSHSSPSSYKDLTGESRNRRVPRVLIVDARSFSAAVANRGRGGGYECPEYYPNCDIQYMNLANIHTIRKSFQALRHLCYSSSQDPVSWLSWLETSKWMTHLSALLKSALAIVRTVASEGRPVVIHCSDGWDRTPQLVALAELIMDPFYRRIDGFQVLIEREWLAFGHKFGDRCGQGCGPGSNAHDQNERCPVFSQWLDCVYQLMHQFPTAFQFNSNFLISILQHVYSNVFGTFLFNSAQERQQNSVYEQTYSLWSYLRPSHGSRFVNPLYAPNEHQTLFPSWNVRDLVVWPVYLPGRDAAPPPSFPLNPLNGSTNSMSSLVGGLTPGKLPSMPKPPSSLSVASSVSVNSILQKAVSVAQIAKSESSSEIGESDDLEEAETVVNGLGEDENVSRSSFKVGGGSTTTMDDYSDLADDEAEDDDDDDDRKSDKRSNGSCGQLGSATPKLYSCSSDPTLTPSNLPPPSMVMSRTGSCPLCYPGGVDKTGTGAKTGAGGSSLPVDDSVLDRIDFVQRQKTDPETQREAAYSQLLARHERELAALKWDLHCTRLKLLSVNRCQGCRPYGAGDAALNGREMKSLREDDESSDSNGLLPLLVNGDREFTVGYEDPILVSSYVDPGSASTSVSGWEVVSTNDKGLGNGFNLMEAEEAIEVREGGEIRRRSSVVSTASSSATVTGMDGPRIFNTPGSCRSAKPNGQSPRGSFRGTRRHDSASSTNKGAKMVQPVHT